MRLVQTQVDINAPAQTVWEVLTDFESYQAEGWNSYIESIQASLRPGARVTAVTKSPQLLRRDPKARVVSGTFPELSWEAKLPIPGIVYARHYFTIESTSADTSRLIQGERVSGILTRAVFHLVEKSEPGFVILNEAIKHRAEARTPAAR